MLLTALTVGLLGGVHCLGMCGGVVSALTLRRVAGPARLADQIAYNFGRIATYVVVGALAGGLGGAAVASASLLPAQLMLFVLANGMLILLGAHVAGGGGTILAVERIGARVWPLLRSVGQRLPRGDTPLARIAAGAVWGWTPCGLVYSMLALALVSGGAGRGAAVMLAFGLGTLPNLLGAAWLLRRFGAYLRERRARVAAGVLIAVFGILGIARAPGLLEHVREGLLCVTG